MFVAQFDRIAEYNWLSKKFADAVKNLYPHPVAIVTQQLFDPVLFNQFVVLNDTTIDIVTGKTENNYDTKFSCSIESYPIKSVQKISAEFSETALIPNDKFDISALKQKLTISFHGGQEIVIDYMKAHPYYLQALLKELDLFSKELKARM
ncbi:hypothetical protein AB432_018430 [Brevibacillus brevis]|uniref:Uncharacterized protein n=1 Tax=Brevibacillus brevis TaxID=1393 RepID=A0A2Z4MKI1_BREBE|nr:hypothetical protein [Brevibacillus brevis]AWX56901.1 hypothetical protein AB432_018430 [Brevibacillus brevis]